MRFGEVAKLQHAEAFGPGILRLDRRRGRAIRWEGSGRETGGWRSILAGRTWGRGWQGERGGAGARNAFGVGGLVGVGLSWQYYAGVEFGLASGGEDDQGHKGKKAQSDLDLDIS
ncbi:15409_t:CDS:2, partial [Cetraspora pellucida]